MKKVTSMIAVLLMALLLPVLILPATQKPAGHAEWIASSLKEIQKIKVGMTRGELLKVFTTEGGLSTRTSRTYVYQPCSYIKVDVEFEPVGGPPKDAQG